MKPEIRIACPKCGQAICDCLLNDRAYLARAVGQLMRGKAGGLSTRKAGDICFSGEEDDTHTNGKTRGIEPAPQWVVDWAAAEIGGPFDLDVAALPENAKAPRFFTPPNFDKPISRGDGIDGLKQRWDARRIWVNPPYNTKRMLHWIGKAYKTAQRGLSVTEYAGRGQLVFLHGGYGLATGRFAISYVLFIFDFAKRRNWSFGTLSFKDSFRCNANNSRTLLSAVVSSKGTCMGKHS